MSNRILDLSTQKEVKIRVNPSTRDLINTLCKDGQRTQAEVIDIAIRRMIAQPLLLGATSQIEEIAQTLSEVVDNMQRTLDPNKLLTPKALAGRPLVKGKLSYISCDENGGIYYHKGGIRKPERLVTIN